jgi:Family of unknown function (DUF6152)
MLPLRTKVLLTVGSVWCLFFASVPVIAHHSTAMYNMANPVTVTGVVKRFEWTNPHAFVFLDVKDDKGQTVVWEVEMMSLNHLRGYGWVRNTVKPGDVISCTGGAAKSGEPSMISSFMKLADGRMIKS